MKKLIISSILVLASTGLYASYPEEPCQIPELKSLTEPANTFDELLMKKLDALIELEAKQTLLLEELSHDKQKRQEQ